MTKYIGFSVYTYIGDGMRTLYIFKIKREFLSLYKDNPKYLYDVLKRIYYINNVALGHNLFNQLCIPIDKDEMDRTLFIKLHTKLFYTKQGEDHVINDLYKDEISILRVKNTYIRLELNHNKSYFYDALYNYYRDYFVCDFNSNDYFFLSELKTLV